MADIFSSHNPHVSYPEQFPHPSKNLALEQHISCPECNTKIPIDLNGLLEGKKIVCPTCQITIALAGNLPDSVRIALDEFEAKKKKLGGQ